MQLYEGAKESKTRIVKPQEVVLYLLNALQLNSLLFSTTDVSINAFETWQHNLSRAITVDCDEYFGHRDCTRGQNTSEIIIVES